VFLEQKELPQTVGFPEQLGFELEMASGPALPVFPAAANQEVQLHSQQYYEV
jgi:hypothetical protein